MFESEEVDDDYFTPVAKTSLASIFRKPVSGEKLENESLKYTPPAPKPLPTQEDSQIKLETIVSCVFDAYLWLDNIYTHKGKLGCAVMKHNAADGQSFHSILLYDSKRATVSSAIATNTLQVTVKGKDTISYYDRYEKYWYLRGTEDDVTKIIDALRNCNVNIKVLNEDDNSLLQENQAQDLITDTSKKVIESDTDSSINRKTKTSILNRMASMGQSVLPPRAVSIEPSSDSDTADEIVAVRHKPVKNIAKKTVSEKSMSEYQKNDVHKAVVPITRTHDTKYMGISNQLQSSISTPIASTSGHDFSYFCTEQRINNSELRINMTRIADKVDNILDKVNNLEKDKNKGSAINTIIFQKLIQEYETKIKTYEELLQKLDKNADKSSKQDLSTDTEKRNELVNKLSAKITELDNCIKQKDDEISILNNEIKKLKVINSSQNSRQITIEDELRAKETDLEEVINRNNEILSKLTTENEQLLNSQNNQLENKIKSIMNETFRAIEINFDNNETYSSERIKNIIGTVIKKVTMESLKNLKQQ